MNLTKPNFNQLCKYRLTICHIVVALQKIYLCDVILTIDCAIPISA